MKGLQTAKVVYVREFSRKEAKQRITDYLKTRPSAYVSDIADGLGMDIELAFSVAKELMEKGKVDRAEEKPF